MRITDNCYLITLDMLSHPLHMSNTMTAKCSYLKNIIFLSFFTYNKAVYTAHFFFCIWIYHVVGTLPLWPVHYINTTASLSIAADHVCPFLTTVYPSSDGTFLQDSAPCHKAHNVLNWFSDSDWFSNGLQSHKVSIQEITLRMWWICSHQMCSNWVMPKGSSNPLN